MDEPTLRRLLLDEATNAAEPGQLPDDVRRNAVRGRRRRQAVVLTAGLVPVAAAATVVGVLVTSGANNRTLSITPGQSPAADVVPWVDRPAKPFLPVLPAARPTPPAGTPRCVSTQLRVVDVGHTSYMQSDGLLITLRNTGKSSCVVEGYPESLDGLRDDGRHVNLRPHHASPNRDIGVAPEQRTASVVWLRPDRDIAYLQIFSERSCLNGNGTTQGVPRFRSLSVGMGSRGSLVAELPADVRSYLGCGVGIAPFEAPTTITEQSVAGTDEAVTAVINVPSGVRSGALMQYTVTLINTSNVDVPLRSCPSYEESFRAAYGAFVRAYQLNCDVVHAIPANGQVTYAMQVPVPSTATGLVNMAWRFVGGHGPMASATTAVVDGGSTVRPSQQATGQPAELTAGPYGFKVPSGWTAHPQQNFGGPASYATFDAPGDSSSRINYEVNGGSLGVMYTSGHAPQPNPRGFTGSNTCHLTSIHETSANTARFTCEAPSGYASAGVVMVDPYPQGFRVLQVTLPTADAVEAAQILDSFG